ncbi:hypothetical protein CU110_08545 [Cobetia sp. ICG0124]|nr:hypothetical protein CU110_08545 [Cobetia sp. ICG0124]
MPEDADVTAPNTPTIASATDDVEAVTGALASGDSTNDATPTLTGSAEAGSTVTLTHNGEEIGTTTADSNGTWSFTPGDSASPMANTSSVLPRLMPPPTKVHRLPTSRSPSTPPRRMHQCWPRPMAPPSRAPAKPAPTIEITNTAGDVLGSAEVDTDGNFSVALSPTVTGTGEAGTTVEITNAAGDVLGSAEVDTDGNFLGRAVSRAGCQAPS